MPKFASTTFSSPISPSRTRWRMSTTAGMNQVHIASIRNRSFRAAASTISRAWVALTAKAFSHSTCLPASSAAIVIAWWWLWGDAT